MNDKQIYPISEMAKSILPIHNLPENTDLYEHFSLLKKLPFWEYNFKGFPNPKKIKNSFIKYVNLFYSRDLSCIKQAFPDHNKRKIECARLADLPFNIDTGEFETKIKNILLNQNQNTNFMIVSFLRHNYSDKYVTIMTMRDMYYRSMYDLGKQTEVEVGLEMTRLLKALGGIEKLEIELLGEDNSPELNITLIQTMEAEALGLSPEFIAQNIAENKSPLGFLI